jgi:hypothetical protein
VTEHLKGQEFGGGVGDKDSSGDGQVKWGKIHAGSHEGARKTGKLKVETGTAICQKSGVA